MNPEFQRNVWLELTPRRMILMAGLLALAFFAAALSGDKDDGPAHVAEILYYVIVVVWGTRNAATAVVGEIRDRTWDMQLLSSITPGEMTWGKLFGSTVYNWFGGAICLAVMLSDTLIHKGAPTAAIDLVYYLAIGAIAQAAAFLASLIAVRRRQSHSRLDVFIYQVVGLIAGIAVWGVWSAADPAGSILMRQPASDFVMWWGRSFDTRGFLLVSLAIFTFWTLIGCYREMRLELKMKNGPSVWLAFVVFMGVYVAGFDAWLENDKTLQTFDAVALRLALALTTYVVLTYLMVFLEPKDRVHYRWLGSQLSSGRVGSFLGGMQAWMIAYLFAAGSAIALIAWMYSHRPGNEPLLIAAGLGFLTRDVSLFVFMRSGRRGDLATVAVLVGLYALAPAIVKGLGLDGLLMAFYPQETQPMWLGAVVAWAEAVTMVVLALSRVSIPNSQAGRSAPSPAS